MFSGSEARAAFWLRVNNGQNIPVNLDGCWLWTGPKIRRGYGRFNFNNKRVLAHRQSYFWFVGPIEKGKDICHHCDTPSCIRPSHLFCGTRSDNMKDCVKKGRHYLQQNPDLAPSGINHPRYGAKIEPDDIPKILNLRSRGFLHREIAAQFGVQRDTIGKLLRGNTWAPYRAEQRL